MKPLIPVLALGFLLLGCAKDEDWNGDTSTNSSNNNPSADLTDYSKAPLSEIYEVSVTIAGEWEKQLVLQSTCPEFKLGEKDMLEKDKYPLAIFSGRSISWTSFPVNGIMEVEVKVMDQGKVSLNGAVKVLPSARQVVPEVEGNKIRFQITEPGQYSLEIGENGYKNGLMIFADPPETDKPDEASDAYFFLDEATHQNINSIPANKSGLYFKKGVHEIGILEVPVTVKNIYLERGAVVFGAFVMNNNPGVKIFGRGVLSGGELNYRASHAIEATGNSDNIKIKGIIIAEPRHFAIRLIGQNNTVDWVKIVGGWVYNTDGISAFAGSSVSNSFIWANDDAIKIYRDNVSFSNIVVWQLNNGGIIQMSWGGSKAHNILIENLTILRAEWNKPGFNRALLSCVGNRYHEPGKSGIQENWFIKNVVTEHPIPVIFNITPDEFSSNQIHNISLENWNVKMDMETEYQNSIIGNDESHPIDGFAFENFQFNNIELTEDNWISTMGITTENFADPVFR